MVTGEDPISSGADGSNRMVTGEDPFASGADGSNLMGTDEAHQSRRSRTRARIEVFSAVMKEVGFKPFSIFTEPAPGYQDLFGVIFLSSCNQDFNHDFVIFDAEALQLPQINSEVFPSVSAELNLSFQSH
ncbi:hypothetical protein FCM35_KLT18181 [Carex littledalei]|uniref:Uncharacterized protein n=1 Tax=Carex littledalei TaxID=544730 RepID=A0A833RNM6_9POAL|nr:hypothetical protein FCM35_KLT18181 [Carex littledalei]